MKKKIFLIVGIIFVILLSAAGSFGYWTWRSTNTPKNVVFNTASDLSNYIVYDEGESQFVGNLTESSSFSGGIHSTISIKKTSEAENVKLYATINMDIKEIGTYMSSTTALKWAITAGDSSSTNVLNEGNFNNTVVNQTIELTRYIEVTTTEQEFTVWIWLDSSENIPLGIEGETVDVRVWTSVDQIIQDVFEVSKVDINYQFVTASVENTTSTITNYAVTTSSTEPTSWTTISSSVNAYNLEYTATQTGTYYVWFKDASGNITSKSFVVSEIDTTGPVCTFGSWEPSQVAFNSNAMIELTCVDEETGVYHSDINAIATANGLVSEPILLAKTKVDDGYKYTYEVTSKTTAGTDRLSIGSNSLNVDNKAGLYNNAASSPYITIGDELTFVDQEFTSYYYRLTERTFTPPTGGSGNYTYTISGTGSDYFTISGTTLTISMDADLGQYDLTVTATDTSTGQTISAAFTVTVNYLTYKINLTNNGDIYTYVTVYVRYGDDFYVDSYYEKPFSSYYSLPVKTGYTFTGYDDSSGNTIIDEEGSIGAIKTTAYTSDVTLTGTWRINKIYVKFHMNGGSFDTTTSTTISYSGSYITRSDAPYPNSSGTLDSTVISTYNYGNTDVDLVNPDNTTYINIQRTGYTPTSGAEWKNTSGTTSGTTYSDSGGVDSADLCDASYGDCWVTLYVNWRINVIKVQYHMNGGTFGTTSSTAISYSGNYITKNGSTIVNTYNYGTTSADLVHPHNSTYVNITRSGYVAFQDKEWKNTSGTTTGTTYDESGVNSSTLCDASADDCTVTLYVNWATSVKANRYTCLSYSGSYRMTTYYVHSCLNSTCAYTSLNGMSSSLASSYFSTTYISTTPTTGKPSTWTIAQSSLSSSLPTSNCRYSLYACKSGGLSCYAYPSTSSTVKSTVSNSTYLNKTIYKTTSYIDSSNSWYYYSTGACYLQGNYLKNSC